ncbi:MAG: apolipoprotein N-acyltransferase, partial [Proteobacteria bacterium]|nr:apolipoprotein N-acyltransferase [Pseudomonadota bacterium]
MPILILLCAVGGLFGLPNPWLHVPPAALLFPFSLTWIAWRAIHPKQAFLLGWLGGTFALCSIFYWTAVPCYRYGGLPLWLSLLAPLGISVLLSLYFAQYSLLMHHAARKLSAFPLILCAGVLWFVAEHLNSFVLSGFPWNALSSGFAVWPSTMQGASLIGGYGMSGLLAALAVSLLMLNTARSAWVTAVLILAFLGGYGPYRMNHFEVDGPELNLALIQGNIDQAVKWDLAFHDKTIKRYADLTDSALMRDKVDLAVWPETALPFYFQENSPSTAKVYEYLHTTNITLLVGAP